MILGIESTAHTFGIGIVDKGKILVNVKDSYTTETGGIIPIHAAKHHKEVAEKLYQEALKQAKIKDKDIKAIAVSNAPGLAPCLIEGMKFAKKLATKLKVPLVPVNHCIAHLEIGRVTGAKDPVMLYVSGANTQIIAYEAGKYRIFGETLDMGVGNFIDSFARHLGIGFPGGVEIEKLAKQSKNYIELPYTVKGMDIVLSGILTNLRQKIERMNTALSQPARPLTHLCSQNARELIASKSTLSDFSAEDNVSSNNFNKLNIKLSQKFSSNNYNKFRASSSELGYTKEDLCFSMQETVFAMLVEVAERALAHTGKKELLLGGGVACNKRLQEMCDIMCKERGAKLFVPENSLLVDNGAFIAYTGEILYKNGDYIEIKDIDKLDIYPRQRTDEVSVSWR